MSGTSADGIDAALVEIVEVGAGGGTLRVRTLAHCCVDYNPTFRQEIFSLFTPPESTVDKICRMNVQLGEEFARAALKVIALAGLRPGDVHVIGSHGQTIHHMPQCHATLQIGEAAVIAERTGITTVSNFRARDLAAGGEGAPLVPYFDWVVFSHPSLTRVMQNIGGIANMTVLPAGCDIDGVTAFDNGPGNMIIDGFVTELSGGAMTYDRDGEMAARGHVVLELLEELMGDEFVRRDPPKTAGREQYGRQYVQALIRDWRARGIAPEDMVATATAFTAEAILLHLRERVIPACGLDELIVSGGGARNPMIMQALARGLEPARCGCTASRPAVVTSDDRGVPSDAKEAVAFAVLAYQTIMGRPGNVPGATGASRPVVLGCVTPA
jgi:anhydro-N-acetylmuramic acid kinase